MSVTLQPTPLFSSHQAKQLCGCFFKTTAGTYSNFMTGELELLVESVEISTDIVFGNMTTSLTWEIKERGLR